jgi:hypothetical protein
MRTLSEATERICELKGDVLAVHALLAALIDGMPVAERVRLAAAFDAHAEVARTVLLNAPISEHTLAAFERDVTRTRTLLQRP